MAKKPVSDDRAVADAAANDDSYVGLPIDLWRELEDSLRPSAHRVVTEHVRAIRDRVLEASPAVAVLTAEDAIRLGAWLRTATVHPAQRQIMVEAIARATIPTAAVPTTKPKKPTKPRGPRTKWTAKQREAADLWDRFLSEALVARAMGIRTSVAKKHLDAADRKQRLLDGTGLANYSPGSRSVRPDQTLPVRGGGLSIDPPDDDGDCTS